VLSGVMRFAARHGAVTITPVREVARIEVSPGVNLGRCLPRNASNGLLPLRPTTRYARGSFPDLTLMMLATGCRIGECLAIGGYDGRYGMRHR
jgi:hypothetical protein